MILDGKNIKREILDEIREEVNGLSDKLKLVVIQVGDDEASNVYIKQKANMCNYVGYDFEHIKLENTTTDGLISLINNLNNDSNVTGIMVQLPLPLEKDISKVINSIDKFKDVDGLTDYNKSMLYQGKEGLYPCTPLGIIELLDRYNISLDSKNVVIIGRSELVGKPLSMMMLNKNATVTLCHSKTKNLSEYTKMADVLVSAVGKYNLVTADMVKDNAILVDVGINKIGNKLYGDIDFNNVLDKVSYITPVPGGVGPMTVAILARNLLKAYKMKRN